MESGCGRPGDTVAWDHHAERVRTYRPPRRVLKAGPTRRGVRRCASGPVDPSTTTSRSAADPHRTLLSRDPHPELLIPRPCDPRPDAPAPPRGGSSKPTTS